MRPSIRFEVFKRDGFTCAYCGRKPPKVTLEIDHVIPRAESGGDESENLVTSCWDCNRGKGARPLDDRAPTIDMEAQTELIRERELQLRAFHEAKQEQAERRDAQVSDVLDYWFSLYGDELYNNAVPWDSVLGNYVDELGVYEVKAGMDIAHEKFHWPGSRAVKYFIGVCRRKVAEQEGRVRVCSVCEKRIILTIEQAKDEEPGSVWHHTDCVENI